MTTANNSRVLWIIPLLLIMVLFCPFTYGKVIYIDDDGQADFDNIQAGIDAAVDGDTVLVAPGTYTGEGNRDIDFKSKAITVRSIDPNDPAIIASTIIDCQAQGRGFTFESGEQADSILEGITITNGYTVNSGSGILVSNSSPTIAKSTISRSSTKSRGNGGGICIYNGQPTISYCSIIENTAGSGGGLYIHESSPLISHCIIADNYALASGGLRIVGTGWSEAHAIRLENCRISDNSANSLSGGIFAMLCTLQMSNCIVSGNRLLYGGAGGGLYIELLSILEINQCTIVGNKVVQYSPAVNCFGGGIFIRVSDVKISNSIIRRNWATKGAQLAIHSWDGQQWPDEPPMNDPTLVTLHYNDFNSEQDEELYIYGEPNLLTLEMHDNLDADPCFADAGYWDPNGTPDDPSNDFWVDGDYHLKSQAGRWDPASESWVQDDVTSPCIDAGDPNSPIGSEPFPNGGIINMGAYGSTAEASKSLIGMSTYAFVSEQSTIIQTGGIAGVNWTYALAGQFRLTVDFGAGKAWFSNIEATATDESMPDRKLDPNDVFNLTSLTGTISTNGSIRFTGRAADGSDVLVDITLSNESVSIKGQTIPPPDSADFFIFNLDAVAKRKYGGGTGESNNSYLIYTAEQLNAISAEPNDWDKHFKLMADIDLAAYSYDAALIGPDGDSSDPSFQGTSFTGVFDGSGHAISNLIITGESYLGLFGRTEYQTKIKNLSFIDVNIIGTDYVGGLVGFNNGSITSCSIAGSISGNNRVGGIAGRNWGSINTSRNEAAVTGYNDVGGLTAGNYGTISNSYNIGVVSANSDVGGLVGENYGTIDKCYSTGAVSGERRFGGFVSLYWESAIITSSFWDVETSGQTTSAGGTGKTTAEMQTASTFLETGWDFVGETANGTEDIWRIFEGRDYPRLWWEAGD